ncbi:type VII secretion protein EccE [Gordonia sp. ABSL49_1]|uniref:type VII secretion protein EccE n=1 Tax=Gordonia sp. ABSL49_1 TaxID=2920941 RepID=UPI001F0E4121|nr:type VII secretion protein EccE [Gordonia sp. ABSL49_1]MCH5643757.1 type VII secretion protein EccE [Gordonia sp. ABSL49_1]
MLTRQTDIGTRRSPTVDTVRRRESGTGPRMGLASVVLIEAVLAGGLIVWAVIGNPWGIAAMALALVASLGVVPVGTDGSIAQRLHRRLSFRWSRWRRTIADLAPAPFDIPASSGRAKPTAPTADVIGARWVARTLVTMIRVEPGGHEPTFLTPNGADPRTETGQLIPFDVLAACVQTYDIRLRSIDVISHSMRAHGTGPVTATYLRTLGPLPAIARRSTFVVLRLDPLDCPDAVARRGGGAIGALRTATTATRRVAARLTEHGLHATVLSAAEITAAGSQLLDGAPLESAAEDWRSVSLGALRMRTGAIDPAMLAGLRDFWVASAVSTTVTVRMRRSGDEVEVAGFARVGETGANSAQWPHTPWPHALRPLDGRQFDALALSLPIAKPAHLDRNIATLHGDAALAALRSLKLSVTGCGQLIGADRSGRAVAMRVAGPDIPSVIIAADLTFLVQVLLRAVAIGVSVVVYTDRAHRWAPAMAAVGDRSAFGLASDQSRPRGPAIMVVVDGVPRPQTPPGVTVVTALPPGVGVPPVGDATLTLQQNPRAPHCITLTTPTSELDITMVATPDEWRLIGAHPGPIAPVAH